MKIERFLKEINGNIKDLDDDLKAEFALIKDTKDLRKSDLDMKKVLCKSFRVGQQNGYKHVIREYEENNCLIELKESLELSVKNKEFILSAAFRLDNEDSQFIKMQEQGMKSSYEFVIYMLGNIEQ